MKDHAAHAVERVERAIAHIRAGKLVILTDDEDRENEGDLCMAAEKVTAAAVNFMAKYGRGLICVALTHERADELELPLMTETNTDPQGTAFTVSVDAHRRFGVTTGISAHDRAMTVKVILDPESRPQDLRRPGHIFPLRAKPGGVLRRIGQTEAGVDLARLAGARARRQRRGRQAVATPRARHRRAPGPGAPAHAARRGGIGLALGCAADGADAAPGGGGHDATA